MIGLGPGLGGVSVSAVPAFVQAETASDLKCVQCVTTRDLGMGSVSRNRLGDDSVISSKIRDGSVTSRDLAPKSVTWGKINDNSVDWQKLALTLQQRIVDLESRLTALEEGGSGDPELESRVSALEEVVSDSTVLKLDGYLDLDTSDSSRPTAVFAGVNVQVVNGTGDTMAVNGLGNLIVGYDNAAAAGDPICSDGQFETQEDCVAGGELWALNHKSGSHNLIVGPGHRYSQASGLVAGRQNAINRNFATVSGGYDNIASGQSSSISGGLGNVATGHWSTISGGKNNEAGYEALAGPVDWPEPYVTVGSHVSGGSDNVSAGDWSAIAGGADNSASGYVTTVAGGLANRVWTSRLGMSQPYQVGAHVCGGRSNSAWATGAVVVGGTSNEAGGWNSVVIGGEANRAAAFSQNAVVAGGKDNLALGGHDVVIGGSDNRAESGGSVIIGGQGSTARGAYSVVNGGRSNVTTNEAWYSVVGGGNSRQTVGEDDWVAGSLWEDF